MAEKVKALEKHVEIVSQINLKMDVLQTKIEKLNRWRNMEKVVPSGLLEIKAYDIRLHTLATNECQDLASKFEERAREILVGMMNVYDKSVQDVQKYLQWPEINFRDKHPISFDFFEEIEDKNEVVKEEVQSKEFTSKEDIQELLVNPSQEFPLYMDFIHKFMIVMDNYRECNLTLDIKKEHIFNSREERILTQHEGWSKHFQSKGG